MYRCGAKRSSSVLILVWPLIPTHCRCSGGIFHMITHTHTHTHSWQNSSGQGIRPSVWQHTTFTRDKHPCPRWDSNPHSQQTSGLRPRGHRDRHVISVQKFSGLRRRGKANKHLLTILTTTKSGRAFCRVTQFCLLRLNHKLPVTNKSPAYL